MRQILILVILLALLGACTPYDDNVADDDVLVIQTVYADQQVHHAGDSVKIYTVLQGTPPSGLTYAYQFTLSSGTIVADGSTATVTLAQAGRAVVKVTVTAPDGRVATRTIDLMGQNLSPVLVSWTIGGTTLVKGSVVNMEVQAHDKDLDTLQYSITLSTNFGTLTSTSTNGQATYSAPTDRGGSVVLTVSVRDGVGGQFSFSQTLTVEKSWERLHTMYSFGYAVGVASYPYFTACGDGLGRFYLAHRGRVERSDSSGTNWSIMASSYTFGGTANKSFPPLVQCNSQNIPYVLHRVGTGVTNFVLSVYSNNVWQTNSPVLGSVTNIWTSSLQFKMGLDDRPMVGKVYQGSQKQLEIAFLSNNVWQVLPMFPVDSSAYECARLADGSVWVRCYYNSQYILKRWNGSSWEDMAQPGTGTPLLQTAGGSLWLAQNSVFYRWNGSSWENVFVGVVGVLAVGEDGAYHVYHDISGGYQGYSIRGGVKESYRYASGTIKYVSIYARGNPSVPYRIYRVVSSTADSFRIGTVK